MDCEKNSDLAGVEKANLKPNLNPEQETHELARRLREVTCCAGTSNDELDHYQLAEIVWHGKALVRQLVLCAIACQQKKEYPMNAAGFCASLGYFLEDAQQEIAAGNIGPTGYPLPPKQPETILEGVIESEKKRLESEGPVRNLEGVDPTPPPPAEMPSLEVEGPRPMPSEVPIPAPTSGTTTNAPPSATDA